MTAPRRRLVFAVLGLAIAMVAGGPVVPAQTSSRLPIPQAIMVRADRVIQ